MPMYKYQRFVTPGPNGTTIYFCNTEAGDLLEVAELDGWRYVHVPDKVEPPEQPEAIQWQAAPVDAELRERLKAVSRPCHLIEEAMQRRIRARYSLEDEQYFARIGVGVALGAYAFQPGEQQALLDFGAHVEAVRQWGKAERARIGL